MLIIVAVWPATWWFRELLHATRHPYNNLGDVPERILLQDDVPPCERAGSGPQHWARRREVREGRRMLFPIGLVNYNALRDWECFDADIGKDLATEIREYFIPDFSIWNRDHTAYQKAFARLLRDLNTKGVLADA